MHLDLATLGNPNPLKQAFVRFVLRHNLLSHRDQTRSLLNGKGSLASQRAMSICHVCDLLQRTIELIDLFY